MLLNVRPELIIVTSVPYAPIISGYTGNGITCIDDHECADESDNCASNRLCTHMSSSFSCSCKIKYNGDGLSYTDVDECNAGSDTGYTGDETACSNASACTTGSL